MKPRACRSSPAATTERVGHVNARVGHRPPRAAPRCMTSSSGHGVLLWSIVLPSVAWAARQRYGRDPPAPAARRELLEERLGLRKRQAASVDALSVHRRLSRHVSCRPSTRWLSSIRPRPATTRRHLRQSIRRRPPSACGPCGCCRGSSRSSRNPEPLRRQLRAYFADALASKFGRCASRRADHVQVAFPVVSKIADRLASSLTETMRRTPDRTRRRPTPCSRPCCS